MSKPHVVSSATRYQDCTEYSAEVCDSLEAAVAVASKWSQPRGDCHTTCRVFELGPEVKVLLEETEIPQPAVKTVRVVVAG